MKIVRGHIAWGHPTRIDGKSNPDFSPLSPGQMKIVGYLDGVHAEDYVLAVIPSDGLELLHVKLAHEPLCQGCLTIFEKDYTDIIDDRTAVLTRIKKKISVFWDGALQREMPELKRQSDIVADLWSKRFALDEGFKI